MLPLAEQMIRTSEQIVSTVGRQDTIAGYVRVGVTEIIAHTWLAHFMELLKRNHPGITLELEVAISHDIERKLSEGLLDMAMSPCELPASHYINVELGKVVFHWMASPKLADVPAEVEAKDLINLPVILRSKQDHHRGAILDWLTDSSVQLRSLTICNTFTAAAAMARAGLGVALLPIDIYHDDVSTGLLKIIKCKPEIRPLRFFSARPKIGQTALHRVIESAAVEASSFKGKAKPQ